MIDLRLGPWQEALSDVESVDLLCTDTPYSERTHAGHDAGIIGWRNRGERHIERRLHEYPFWTEDDVAAFVGHWAPRCRGWFLAQTDHVLAPSWERAFCDAGFYTFAPLPIVLRGSRRRHLGDGPPCWAIWLMVARPRTAGFFAWGALPGWYAGPPERSMLRVGGKPLWLMRALVRDYSRPGQLVCDPCAGGATTLLAAAMEGRRAVGAELDPETFEKARQRLSQGFTPDMLIDVPDKPLKGCQLDLLPEDADAE